MKIFISWSGSLSLRVATELRDWLRVVLQAVHPYVSSEDIHKGERWDVDISRELKESKYGIICVTKENLTAPWLNFEAGALSNRFKKSRVSPFLFEVEKGEVAGPLGQFQATVYERSDMLRLVESINAASPDPLEQAILERSFNRFWPDLEAKLDPLKNASRDERVDDEPGRRIEDNLTEILQILSELKGQPAERDSDSDTSHTAPLPASRSEQDVGRPMTEPRAARRRRQLSRKADASALELDVTDTVRSGGHEREAIRCLLDARQHARLAGNEEDSARRHLLDALDEMIAALGAAQEGDTSRVSEVLRAAQQTRNDEGRRLLLARQHESDAEASLDAAMRSLLPSGEEVKPQPRTDIGDLSPKAATIPMILDPYVPSKKRISVLAA